MSLSQSPNVGAKSAATYRERGTILLHSADPNARDPGNMANGIPTTDGQVTLDEGLRALPCKRRQPSCRKPGTRRRRSTEHQYARPAY